MTGLTIMQAREARAEAEKQITQILTALEEKTGASVAELQLSKIEIFEIGVGRRVCVRDVTLRLELP